ncbi:alpha/beta fold hydrolase [Jidongwangia harbinensis]|uniref:alpha/beta fold hydrolase n=1 Tax=Jidongwangia harbinensis TaxID=2878561 RepID=UPI001CD9BA82|nr:alpha/beta hydrolase [Jidongwangia harbinensis]MCA2217682.1 alpha/beta hydrolase [Jidongwangia harbinensis]
MLTTGDLALALAAPAPVLGWASRWRTVAGLRCHERFRDDRTGGLPVVLLHGLAVSHRYLMPTAHALADRHPVVVPDLPGFGLSAKPRTAFDVGRHAAHLAARLDGAGLSGVAVLGHSFGAEVAVARPDLVAALILAGPTANPAARHRRGLIGRFAVDLLVEDPRQTAILARDMRDAKPWRVWATLGRSVHNAVEADLARVRVPTLVLGGQWDPIAPPRWRHQVATLCGGTSVTVPRAGHNALTTAGRRSADLIADHLAAVMRARAVTG